MHWYLTPWRKYAVFHGRARRTEYWTFVLTHVVLMNIVRLLADHRIIERDTYHLVVQLYLLILVLPTVAVAARRMHDTGRSGWLALFTFTPVVPVLALFDGQRGPNQYGPDPKAQAPQPQGQAA
ncbi:DUF805 domain-containing protein [Streptomyces sp. NPDC059740]|uniref:DUF805 domain-containing protein n=1 Tax=Streptomyces sp. NPDC059740 TaxID=3346926 RepID=UPI003656C5C5